MLNRQLITCLVLIATAGLVITALVGCNQNDNKQDGPLKEQRARKARIIFSNFVVYAKGDNVKIEVNTSAEPPAENLPITALCANWRDDRLTDKITSKGIWRARQRSILVRMPASVDGRQACGLSWTVGQQPNPQDKFTNPDTKKFTAVGFFNPAQGKDYLIKEQAKRLRDN